MLIKALNITMFALMVVSFWAISAKTTYYLMGKEIGLSLECVSSLGMLTVSAVTWVKSKAL